MQYHATQGLNTFLHYNTKWHAITSHSKFTYEAPQPYRIMYFNLCEIPETICHNNVQYNITRYTDE